MTRMLCRQICLIALVLTVLLLPGAPAEAAPQAHCFRDLSDCVDEANLHESFWAYYWDALDCELTLIRCVQEYLSGE